MKAEDKAKELFDKYVVYAKRPQKTENISKENWIYEITENAKQCALICVDEILKIMDIANKEYDLGLKSFQLKQEIYWQEVKQEIEKL